ncbi:uncharacterized protein VTP21DRAFT_6218 [Calcarisporiella thermophila]|uniref:uncharacterized protein n=1 Tax=Calcarisporiella thermophila TaxID=911321 RepID=UPI003743B830
MATQPPPRDKPKPRSSPPPFLPPSQHIPPTSLSFMPSISDLKARLRIADAQHGVTREASELPTRIGRWINSWWEPPADSTSLPANSGGRPPNSNSSSMTIGSAQSRNHFKIEKEEEVWLMGQRYLEGEEEAFKADFESRIWMTYRYNFPPIRPANFTSDVGWGCMLRSGQSLLANALQFHLLGRDWKRCDRSHETWLEYAKIITWFLDVFGPQSPFAIHRVALLGKQLGKNIGEWFGPSTASSAIKALVTSYETSQLTVYSANDGVIYRDQIAKLSPGGFRPLLILIPIRLGTDRLNPIYHHALKAYLRLPQSVGIAGGKPCSSLYFVGYRGDEMMYLDPHVARPAIEPKALEDFTEEELATFHCEAPLHIPISQLDPSMLFGFYVRDEREFEEWCAQISAVAHHGTPILSVAESAPVYDDELVEDIVECFDEEEEMESRDS